MLLLRSLALFVLLSTLAQGAFAQGRAATTKVKTKVKAGQIDSVQWRREHYIVNRDSAFAFPRVALRTLIGGNRRFVENKAIRPRQDRAALLSVEKKQKPFAVIVGCSDSRVPNEIIFDQGVGDLFIVRTAGQVMAAASYGSIEFAAVALGTKLVVVMGHQSCGAVNAAINRPDVPGHIVTLVNSIKHAAAVSKDMPGDRLDNAVRENVLEQVQELRDLDPVLSRKYQAGEVLIVGAVYQLHTGQVEFLPETLKDLPAPAAKPATAEEALKH